MSTVNKSPVSKEALLCGRTLWQLITHSQLKSLGTLHFILTGIDYLHFGIKISARKDYHIYISFKSNDTCNIVLIKVKKRPDYEIIERYENIKISHIHDFLYQLCKKLKFHKLPKI